MKRLAPILLTLLAVGLAAVPAPAQHGYSGSYTYYQAGYHGGRYYNAGYYGYHNGTWYQQGSGACYGYANEYAATVVVKPTYVYPPFGWSVSAPAYAPPAAPASDVKDKFLESLLLKDQQQSTEAAAERRQTAAFNQQMTLMLMQMALSRPADPSAPAPVVPVIPQIQPIPPASGGGPKAAPAPAKLPPLEAFVQAHCIACHGTNGAKGNLDLSDLAKLSAERWADCWDAICDDTMPPKSKVPPAEKTAVKGEFRQRIFARK